MQSRCVPITLSYVKALTPSKEYLQIILQEFIGLGFVPKLGHLTGAAVGIPHRLDLGGGGIILDGGHWNIGWLLARFVRRTAAEQVTEAETRQRSRFKVYHYLKGL